MKLPLCRHIKTNGQQCQSPSLAAESWCYFHSRLHHRHQRFFSPASGSESDKPTQHVQLNALEDPESVQVALSVVLNALASGQMEPRRASVLLYGLQLASSNIRRLSTPYAGALIRKVQSTTPEGLDLAAPGNTLDITSYRRLLGLLSEDDEEEDEHEDKDGGEDDE